jgi:hypothetical protein
METLKTERRILHYALMQIEFYLGAGGGDRKDGQSLVDCILKKIQEVSVLIHRMNTR